MYFISVFVDDLFSLAYDTNYHQSCVTPICHWTLLNRNWKCIFGASANIFQCCWGISVILLSLCKCQDLLILNCL